MVFDDARHFLQTTTEKFDIITSDPIHPWVRGAATLYSVEYLQFVREHLNPGGVVTQWVPLYETDERSVKSQIGTFAQRVSRHHAVEPRSARGRLRPGRAWAASGGADR